MLFVSKKYFIKDEELEKNPYISSRVRYYENWFDYKYQMRNKISRKRIKRCFYGSYYAYRNDPTTREIYHLLDYEKINTPGYLPEFKLEYEHYQIDTSEIGRSGFKPSMRQELKEKLNAGEISTDEYFEKLRDFHAKSIQCFREYHAIESLFESACKTVPGYKSCRVDISIRMQHFKWSWKYRITKKIFPEKAAKMYMDYYNEHCLDLDDQYMNIYRQVADDFNNGRINIYLQRMVEEVTAKKNKDTYFKNVTSLRDLDKQYKKLVIKHHPDNGGSEDEFLKLTEEYNSLKLVYTA